MCIVFFEWNPDSEIPVYVGANREESTKRPMTDPMAISPGNIPSVIAGADYGADGTGFVTGTWLGVNRNGMIVAVTNRDDGVLHGDDRKHSRGMLCMEVLGQPSVEAAVYHAAGNLEKGSYGGSNYIILDREYCWVVYGPGPKNVSSHQLKPGVHCITNLDMDDPNDERVKHILSRLKPGYFMSEVMNLCTSNHIIVRDPDWATICSSIITVGKPGYGTTFWHSRGTPPLKSDYLTYTQLTSVFDG